MDMDFSPEDLAFQKEVRAFLDDKLNARLREGAANTPSVFTEPDITREWQAILAEKGWLATSWPVEDGGPGWTPTQKYIFEKECAIAGAPSLPILGLRLVGPVICRFGTPEQKARFLPRIISGEDYWCQGYSEPGAGSDLAAVKTRAERVGDKYIVNGSKIWTTHAHHANWIFALVRTDPSVQKQRGISFLLIPMEQPGVSVSPIVTMANDHEVNATFFDNAETPADNLIGEEGQGWTIAKFLLENERGGSCAAPALLAKLDRIERWAREEASGTNGSMIHDPNISQRLARLRLEAQAFEVTELRILAELAKGRPAGPQTSLVKLTSSNLRQQIDELAVDLFGYDGLQLPVTRPLYGNEAPEFVGSRAAQLSMPAYLNGRAYTIFGGSDEVQKTIIAKQVLGL
ncbi:MAG: acyl-CoA dehydrogenase family protein [Sphingomonadales bacterium]|uniref:acyl-CoA dehydrogenase family protein n=1 Tax=Novosphingobium sp. NDB2Meth1 TaxID=1892847 RepID=UPI0009315928|nr:acyl-CoA dehydrogenase family protein [Novosphingobium sp. NDB2Meth1]MBU6394657.1 acyl-CoA dehydrogenase family protein [Sphingomonadales bacterium]